MVLGFGLPEPRRNRPKFTDKDKLPHYKHQGGKCNGCKKKFDIEDLTVDHIKAFSKGGQEKTSNTQLLCHNCNSTKGTGTMKQLEKKLVAKGRIKPPAKTAATKATAKKKRTTKRKPKSDDPFTGIFGF